MNKAFIDDNIWELHMIPKYTPFFNYYIINDIFYYNSLNDRTFERSTAGMFWRVPEKIIKPENRKFVIENKDYFIKRKCPIIKYEIINKEDIWSIDLNEANITL